MCDEIHYRAFQSKLFFITYILAWYENRLTSKYFTHRQLDNNIAKSSHEKMIVNHNSIDLTLHSRSSPSDLRAFKESSTNQDKIGMLKSEELDKRNSNVASIYTKIETNEQRHNPEKSVSSLLMPPISQSVNSSNKSLSELYTSPLPPMFNR